MLGNDISSGALNSGVDVTDEESVAVLPADDGRTALLISNPSNSDIYLAFGAPATVNNGTYLKANGGSLAYGNELMTKLSINAIATSGSGAAKRLTFTALTSYAQ